MENIKENLAQEFENPNVRIKAEKIVQNSFDIQKTLSRTRSVIFFGIISLAIFIYIAFVKKNIQLLGIITIVYVLITIFEKVGYGFGVLAYKKIIQRLLIDTEYRDSCIELLNLNQQDEVASVDN